MPRIAVETQAFRPGAHNIPKNEEGHAVKGGPWIRVDGLETREWPGAEPHIIEKSQESAGYYCANNSRLAVCDAKGRMFVTWDSPISREALHDAGFRPDYIWVPLSNGEQLSDKEAQKTFDAVRKVQKSMDDSGLTGNSVDVTGRSYIRPGSDEPESVPDNTHLVGKYALAKTGVIAFVDMNGKTRVGLKHDKGGYRIDLEERLKESGYQKSTELKVPFGQGETPVKTEKDEPYKYAEFERDIKRIKNTMVYRAGMQTVVREEQKKLQAALESAATPESSEPDRSFLRRISQRPENRQL